MVAEAKGRGLELTGPNGLLKLFTKSVLETALNEELTEPGGRQSRGEWALSCDDTRSG
jgi:transposase-like protein